MRRPSRASTMPLFALQFTVVLTLLWSSSVLAQSTSTPNIQSPGMAVGQSPYAIYNNPDQIDNVNPVTGNIFIKIPLLNYPQVGRHLRLQFNIYYNDKQWYIPNFAPSPQQNGTFTGTWAWWDFNTQSNQIDTIGAYVARDRHLTFGQDDVNSTQIVGQQPTQCTYQTITLGFWVRGSDGSKHYYGDNSSQSDSGNGCTTSPYSLQGSIYPASDESGYTPANGSYVSGSTEVRDADGVLYTSNGVTGETVTDPNGNFITSNANGWTDSVGNHLPGSTALPGYADNGQGTAEDPVPGVPVSVGATDCPTGTTSARDWVVPTEGNTSQHYYLCYSTFTYHTAFNVSSYIPTDQIGELSSSSPNSRPALLLSAIMLPNQTSYKFSYDPQYLSLTELSLPTGGSIQYTWQTVFLGSGNSIPVSRALQSRTVNDGNGNIAKWTYHWQLNETTNSSGGISVALPFYSIVTDPLGNDTEYQFDGTFVVSTKGQYNGCGPHDTFSDSDCSTGSAALMKTESYTQTQITSNAADPNTPGWGQGALYRPTTTVTTLPVAGGNRVAKTVTSLSPPYGAPCTTYVGFGSIGTPYVYNHTTPCSQYPQPSSVASYAYGTSGPGSLLHTDTTTYAWQQSSAYLNANMLDIPYNTVRTDGSSNWASETDYGYDGAGNQTSVSRLLAPGNGLTTTTQFNSQGMPTLITDPLTHRTSISYQCSGAFPQDVITPYQSTTTMVETTVYGFDCTTGKMTSMQDPNNKVTSYTYNDPLSRLKSITYPDGGSLSINYNDFTGSTLPSVDTSQTTGEPLGPITRETDYDGFGRKIHEILTSDTSGADYVDTTYDLLGRVKTVSNPHRPSNPVPTEDGTTTYVYDALGRTVLLQQPDGASSQQWCYGGVTLNGAGNCHSNAAGNSDFWVDHADETQRDWQQTSDAAGRITEALEPNSSNAPSLKTDYSYDANDNLTGVVQHGGTGDTARTRTFKYDPVSRLTNACNPEALASGSSTCAANGPWSQVYAYNADDTVHTRTDGKGVTTTYSYDDLARVTAKNYSDGNTLNAYYYYDVNTCGDPSTDIVIGRVTFSWTSPATSNLGINDPNQVAVHCYTYDSMGRVTAFDTGVIVPGSSPDGYGGEIVMNYDQVGNVMFMETAPNGPTGTLPVHDFDFGYDAAARLTSIKLDPIAQGVPSSIPTTIFQAAANGSSAAYSAMGLEHAQLAVNSSGQPMMLYDHAFDRRGRPASGMYSTGSGAVGGAGSQAYSYTMGYLGNGSVSSAADSIVGTINIGNSGYDNLNRMTALTYTGGAYGGINGAWTYDNFGNQTSQTLSGSSSTPVPGNTTTHYDGQNHISFSSRTGNALPYDGDGNMYYDAQYAYAYDAENRLCAIKSGSTYKIYVYDADGNRVAKGNITPQGTPNPPTVALCSPLKNSFSITQSYAIGLNGEEIENYTPGASWHNTNIYADGRLIATYAGNYLSIPMTDWQGTRRAQLRNTQSMSGLMEFLSLPYGDGFTMVGGTTFDSLVQFTGQQYNQEDNLYNFKTRYLGDWVGRFMSPDDLGGHLEDPQTLNLYSYVGNNPLSRIDPTGHDFWQLCSTPSHVCASQQIGTDKNGNAINQLVSGTTDSNNLFHPTVITSASLSDPNSGNTAVVNGNGVMITTGSGTSSEETGQGIFIANTPAADIKGQGTGWDQFSFHIDSNNVLHGSLTSGTANYIGTGGHDGMVNAINSMTANGHGPWHYPGEDYYNIFHFGDTNMRFSTGTDPVHENYGPSPHFPVPSSGTNVPHFHVDSRTGPGHLTCAVRGFDCF